MDAFAQHDRIEAARLVATNPHRPSGPMSERDCALGLKCFPHSPDPDCKLCGGYGAMFQLRDTNRWLSVDEALAEPT